MSKQAIVGRRKQTYVMRSLATPLATMARLARVSWRFSDHSVNKTWGNWLPQRKLWWLERVGGFGSNAIRTSNWTRRISSSFEGATWFGWIFFIVVMVEVTSDLPREAAIRCNTSNSSNNIHLRLEWSLTTTIEISSFSWVWSATLEVESTLDRNRLPRNSQYWYQIEVVYAASMKCISELRLAEEDVYFVSPARASSSLLI